MHPISHTEPHEASPAAPLTPQEGPHALHGPILNVANERLLLPPLQHPNATRMRPEDEARMQRMRARAHMHHQAERVQRQSQIPLQNLRNQGREADDAGANASAATESHLQRIQRTLERHDAELAAVNNAIQELMQQSGDVQRQDLEHDRRILALAQGIDRQGRQDPYPQRNIEERRIAEQEIQEIAELSAMLARGSQAADEAFQVVAAAVRDGLHQISERQSDLESLEQTQVQATDYALSAIAAEIEDLQRELSDLDGSFHRLQAGLQVHAENARLIAGQIDEMSSEEYCQQELQWLQHALEQLPDPVVDRILPFYRQMRADFASNMRRVERLNVEDELLGLQRNLLENSVALIDQQLDQIEMQSQALQAEMNALPQAIENTKSSLLQLQAYTSQVKKLLKKQQKAQFMDLLQTVAAGATVVMTGGSSLAILELVVTATGLDEKINQLTQKIMQPLTKCILKPFMPIIAPIAKATAPINKYLGIVNAVLTPASILIGGGTLEQALKATIESQVLSMFSAKGSLNLILNPVDALMQEVMKSAAPIFSTMSNLSTAVDSTKAIVNDLTPQLTAGQQTTCTAAQDARVSKVDPRTPPRAANTERQALPSKNTPQASTKETPRKLNTTGRVNVLRKAENTPAEKEMNVSKRVSKQTPLTADKRLIPPKPVAQMKVSTVTTNFQQKPAKVATAQPSKDAEVSLRAQVKTTNQKNEMSIYRTAQANLNPLMPFARPSVQAKQPSALNKTGTPTANLKNANSPNALDCSWKGSFRAGMERIAEDEMAKMSPEQFKKDFVKGTKKLAANIAKNKASMQDPVDDEIVGQIFSFSAGWKEHNDKCQASTSLDKTPK